MGLLASCSSRAVVPARAFPTPEEASRSLAEAAERDSPEVLVEIFGAEAEELISSGDPVDDAAARARFAKLYREKNRIERVSDGEAVLHVGPEDWPFPIPMVRDGGGGWVFNVAAGKEEIIDRRIGKNELDAIQTCLAIVDAQREYVLEDRDRDGLIEYAARVLSSPGKRDGLYWETKEGEAASPLGPLVAEAEAAGYGVPGEPYHGYFYRLLDAQGPNAPGGAYEYKVGENWIGGFALIAYPAEYGSSGIMTFLTNHDGTVYEKDLGEGTDAAVEKITLFDPDGTWMKVEAPEAGAD